MTRHAKSSSVKRQWKRAEQSVASFYGTDRTPLSGGNSKQTRSDTRSERLFIECKVAAEFAAYTLLNRTRILARVEDKIPVVALKRLGTPGHLICVHSSDLVALCEEVLRIRNAQASDGGSQPAAAAV